MSSESENKASSKAGGKAAAGKRAPAASLGKPVPGKPNKRKLNPNDRKQVRQALAAMGQLPGDALPIADAALLLAAYDTPGTDIQTAQKHLKQLKDDLEKAVQGLETTADRAAALSDLMAVQYGYKGDIETYDDMRNANLAQVIARRQGLPVAIGILYMHVGRTQGWTMKGLNLPGHFIIRLEDDAGRVILDPFYGGRLLQREDIKGILEAFSGRGAVLLPEHTEAVTDREVLVRLLNNQRMRAQRAKANKQVLKYLDMMTLIAPQDASVLYDYATTNARFGHLSAATKALTLALDRAEDPYFRLDIERTLKELKHSLN